MLIIAANRGPVTLKAQQRPLLTHELEDELKLCCPDLSEEQKIWVCERYASQYSEEIDALIALEAQKITDQTTYHSIEDRLKAKGSFSLDSTNKLSEEQRIAILKIVEQRKALDVYIPMLSSGGEHGLAAELKASGAGEEFHTACWVCWPGVDFVGDLEVDSAEVVALSALVSKTMSTEEMKVAAVLFPKAEQHEYYDIIANSLLWPLMHAARADLLFTASPEQLKAFDKASYCKKWTTEEDHIIGTLIENPPVNIAMSILNKCMAESVESLNSIELKILDATLANPALIFACERAKYIHKETKTEKDSLVEYTEEYERFWMSYKKVNKYFAREIIAQVNVAESKGETAVLWLHDYPLLTTAAEIKKEHPKLIIKYFQHPPFPKADNFILMPYADELIQSLLQADEIRFQILDYVTNFLNTVQHFIQTNKLVGWHINEQIIIAPDGRQVTVEHTPIGINYNEFAAHSEENETATAMISTIKAAANNSKSAVATMGKATELSMPINPKIVFAGGRIDYIKGFVELLIAYKNLLEELAVLLPKVPVSCNSSAENKALIDRVCAIRSIQLVLKVLPTYQSITAYNALWQRINQLVEQIKLLQTTLNLAPMTFYPHSLPMSAVITLNRAADIVVVPVRTRDGFNRMIPEAIASWEGRCSDKHSSQKGVMIVGTGAGVYGYINNVVLEVDSNATEEQFIEQLKEALITGITMPQVEQQKWVVAAQKIVCTDLTITGWIRQCLNIGGLILKNDNKKWKFSENGSPFFVSIPSTAVAEDACLVEEGESNKLCYPSVIEGIQAFLS